jgi:recombination protein RecA
MVTMEDALKELNKSLKMNMKKGDDPFLKRERISTGELLLDDILGGGICRRGILELVGPESSGKTFLTQKIISAAQQQGLTAALMDVEYGYDPEWYKKSGVDISQLYVLQPESAEQTLEAVIALCKAKIDIVVVDSIAALLPEQEDENEMGKQQRGLQARTINKFFRKVPPHNEKTAIILINQLRKDLSANNYNGYIPDTYPGGEGQKYFAGIMCSVRKGELLFADGDSKKTSLPIGFTIKIKNLKNKTAQPFKVCDIPFYYSGESDVEFNLFQIGLTYGLISQSGPYYSYKEYKAQGKEKFMNIFKEDSVILQQLLADIQKEINNDVS